MLIFITNKKLIFEKILYNFKNNFNFFHIKNLGIKNLENLKIKIDKKNFILKNICSIKEIKEKTFEINFNNIEYYKKILKKKYFENYGFQILKKKNNLELLIPNLSVEFRTSILNILKEEYFFLKEEVENLRKKIFLEIKKTYKSKDDVFFLEKKIDKEILIIKKKLKEFFEIKSFEILND